MSAAKKKPALTVTGTAELVLTPQIRKFRGRLYVGAALTVAALSLLALGAVKYLSVVEPMLAAEGANAARAVVYEVPAGADIHVPIEPRTDLLRFVVHAYGKEDMALTPHPARLSLEVKGDKKQRKEEIRADLPGLRSRVTPESAQTGVGDPMSVEVDVHDVGVGEVVVRLNEIAGADGLLVRAYRREQLTETEIALRETALDREKKDELARWTWELGWDELSAPERRTLLRARWRRLGALRGSSSDLKSMTIAISPPPPREPAPAREELLGRVALRGDERIAMIVHPNVKVRFLSDEATMLTATARDLDNQAETKAQAGSVEIGPFTGTRSVEVTAARDVLVEVRSANANETEWSGWSNVYRVSPQRPVLIDSPEADRVVRVSLRKPMARNDPSSAKIAVTVDMWTDGAGRAGQLLSRWNAEKPRSRVDRYADYDSLEAPSERAAFYLSLPKGAHARVNSLDGSPLDVSLAELDTSFPPLPLPTRAPDAPAPLVIAETEDSKSPWVPRRPSNLSAFDEASRKVIRTAHWYAPAPPALPNLAVARIKHPEAEKPARGAAPAPVAAFESIAKPFEVEPDARRPLFVPIVATSDEPARLTIRLDGSAHLVPGVFSRWTLPRTMEVQPNERRATFVIGDDVPANAKLHLRVTPETKAVRGTRQLVLLPWATRAPGARWLPGAYEE